MTPLPLLDGDTLLLDNSSMESHQTCPRQAQYSLCLRRRTSVDRVALRFGGIVHKVLEQRYRLGKREDMYGQDTTITAAMVTEAQIGFAEYTPPEDDYRNLDRVVDLIGRYGKAHPYEEIEILTVNGKPAIEVPFAFPLCTIAVGAEFYVQNLKRADDGTFVKDGTPVLKFLPSIKVLWIGRIDLIYRARGGVYVMDHKTSSMATNMQEFEISHQFYGYMTAAELLTGESVTGTVINRIVCRKPTPKGEPFTFERKLIPKSEDLMAEWKTDIVHMISDFVEMVRRQYLPKHTVWCVSKFGTCPFHKVCSLGSEKQREMMLWSGEYEDNVWSPLT